MFSDRKKTKTEIKRVHFKIKKQRQDKENSRYQAGIKRMGKQNWKWQRKRSSRIQVTSKKKKSKETFTNQRVNNRGFPPPRLHSCDTSLTQGRRHFSTLHKTREKGWLNDR